MDRNELERYMDAAATLVGVPLPTACRSGVLDNLARMHELAASFVDLPLRPEDESAVMFRP
jgi:hypothetical protein